MSEPCTQDTMPVESFPYARDVLKNVYKYLIGTGAAAPLLIYLCETLNRPPMMRSTIESLIKIPLQLPVETSVHSKNEADGKNSINKSANKKEPVEHIHEPNQLVPEAEAVANSQGYIKYPRYDFF